MKSFFTETILNRGKAYFEQNRVFSVNQYDNQTYTGIVLGSEAYHAKITLDEHYDVMSASCDCPYAIEGKHCKHEAALYFAIEDRLPKDEQQYIDINALLKDIRRRTHGSFMLKREFNQEFKKYLKRIIQLNEQGNFHITNYQQVIDEFLSSNYPKDYCHEILQIMFQGYSKLLTSTHNKELTTRWLKENMKYQRYEDAFSYIMIVIYQLDVKDQIDIIREMLLTKRKVSLLNTYFKIINDHHLDMKKYLDDIQIYNNNEDYITEMIRYYVDHQQVDKARSYYKKHEQNIRKKETKAKLDSLLIPENEDAYLNYMCSNLSYYNSSNIPLYYEDLKQFYGVKFENHVADFMKATERFYSEYEMGLMFKRKNEAKYLIYVLLQNPNMTLFEQTKDMIREYSLETYLMLYVECIKDYIKRGTRNYYLNEYVYELFLDLDEISQVEFVDMIKKEFPRRKKIHEILDGCLKEGDEIEIQY